METWGRSSVAPSFLSGIATFTGNSRRVRLDFALDSIAVLAFGAHEIVVELEAEPEAGRCPEVAAEAEVVFRGAAAAGFFHIC